MRRNRLALLATALLALLAVLAPPAAADAPECGTDGRMKRFECGPTAAATEVYGWVWANEPAHLTGEWYSPSARYQFSSVTGGPTNWVRHEGVGTYTVYIDGAPGTGVAHASAYGWNVRARCKVTTTSSSGAGRYVVVRCYSFDGALVDSMFTASYTSVRGRDYRYGYRSAVNGVVTEHNSSTGAVNYAHTAVGSYLVSFKNLGGASGGTVQVTATGQTNVWCKTAGWYPDAIFYNVRVMCFTPAGSPADSEFGVTFVDKGNIVGDKNPSLGLESGYAWVMATRTAPDPWAFPASPAWAVTGSAGVYVVDPAVVVDGGSFQVTAYDTSANSCVIGGWGAAVVVQCYDVGGVLAESFFDVAYVGKRV
ncbi:hypothetical protein [Umezawaea tangerina]|uniref:Ig-like domain-containing protein n=1 Tax=Umezawaea tangerina TaxID=84725 RepID=A0A2T0SS45_9PSEU|nr:hypothetical protein [Umezawaea tangerina]PRY36237.1 hypothetical protein CLV43_112162 [Umezawaea tangerina]